MSLSLSYSRENGEVGGVQGLLSLSLSLSVCACVCVHVRSVTALELVPVPIQSAAVFRDARSVFIRDRAHFFLISCCLLLRYLAVSSVQFFFFKRGWWEYKRSIEREAALSIVF